MIQFFIDNHEIVLPEDFSMSWTEENALITTKGEFSLDLSVSLLVPKNAIAFGFLNRLNKQTITKTVDATSIIDGKVHMGTIIIMNNSDLVVNFQFIAGNSQLKYLAKNEKKIWQLPWGSEVDMITFTKALFTINHPGYGEVNFYGSVLGFNNYVCAPLKVGDIIVNDYLLDNQANSYSIMSAYYNITNEVPLAAGNYYTLETALVAVPSGVRTGAFILIFKSDELTTVGYQYQLNSVVVGSWTNVDNWKAFEPKFIMQPYLLYYINKLPELLGYTLKENILNSDARAKIKYLTNTVDSLNYADALPDMTVTEFKEAIEEFYGVTFLVDPKDKSISIVSLDSSIETKKTVIISNFLQSYERDLSEQSKSVRLDFTQVSYDLPGSDYFKYQRLSDEILLRCEKREFDNYSLLRAHIQANASLGNKLIIYRDLETMRDYFVRAYRDTLTPKSQFFVDNITGVYEICLINKFKNYGDSPDRSLALKIAPAEMAVASKNIIYIRSGNIEMGYACIYQLPCSSNSCYLPKKTGFIDTVEGAGSEVPRNSRLEVSLFTGRIPIYQGTTSDYGNISYPFSHVDIYPEFSATLNNWLADHYQPNITKTMLLTGNNGVVADYLSSEYIDTSKEIIFHLPDSPDVSANNLFFINNLKYMPISFEWEKSIKNNKLVQGKFYRMI